MPGVVIVGLTLDDKVPGFYRQTSYGSGGGSVGANAKTIHLAGTKLSSGSATPDADTKDVTTIDEADAFFGAGSELACMCYAVLGLSGVCSGIQGVTLKCSPVAEAGGAAAATQTITVGGAWTTTGTITFWLMGMAFQVAVAATDTTSTVAAAIDAAFNAVARSPVTSGVAAAVATLTTKSKGVRMKDWVLDVDMSQAPSGLTITLNGLALSGLAKAFNTGGTGADSIANVLALLLTDRYDYQAWAQYDSTNLGLLKTQLDSEAGALIGHLEHAGIASARAVATANSLSNTTINHERLCNPWHQNSQWPPSMIAARIMAIRSTIEGSNPNFNYDDYPTGIPAQRNKADIPQHATLKSALNNGVTPLVTLPDGTVVIKRAIVTHCKDGTSFDYSTLDWGDAVTPDFISDELAARWVVVKANNPYAGPDPGEDDPQAPEGVITPLRWNGDVEKILRDNEKPNASGAILVQDVDDHLPESIWDATPKRILTACPVVVRTQNHQAGVDVLQTAA